MKVSQDTLNNVRILAKNARMKVSEAKDAEKIAECRVREATALLNKAQIDFSDAKTNVLTLEKEAERTLQQWLDTEIASWDNGIG